MLALFVSKPGQAGLEFVINDKLPLPRRIFLSAFAIASVSFYPLSGSMPWSAQPQLQGAW